MNFDLKILSKEQLVQLYLDEYSKVQKQEKENQELQEKVNWQKHLIAQLQRMIFGRKKERFESNAHQTKIQFEEYANEEIKQDETSVKETITYERNKKSKKHNGRNSIPEHLPVFEHVVEPLEDTSNMKK